MDQYCVMGNPVEHSKSPWIHARFAELTNQPLYYGKRLIALDGFAAGIAAFRAEGGRGCNITVPFKFEAAAIAQSETPRARLAQASNTLRFAPDGIHADNTDGVGLINDIVHNAGFALAGRDVLLLGAGGAAAGVLGPLLDASPQSITVANRTEAKAQSLVQRHSALAQQRGAALHAARLDALQGTFDIVVNATASSLAGGGVPVAPAVLRPGALAYDMMYGPAAEEFLHWARSHGAVARDGLGMLVEQAAEAFLIWRGVRPPSQQVLAELRTLLG